MKMEKEFAVYAFDKEQLFIRAYISSLLSEYRRLGESEDVRTGLKGMLKVVREYTKEKKKKRWVGVQYSTGIFRQGPTAGGYVVKG